MDFTTLQNLDTEQVTVDSIEELEELIQSGGAAEEVIAAFFAVFGGLILFALLIVLIKTVLTVIGRWKVFTKAGEKGWKAIIPFYGEWTAYNTFWNSTYAWIALGLSLAPAVLGNFSALEWMGGLCGIATFIFEIFLSIRISKSFGHGAGFTIGLILLPEIFYLILGFNKDKYRKLKD